MTNFFNTDKVKSLTPEQIRGKLNSFTRINKKVFAGIEDPKLKYMFGELLDAQLVALDMLFFGIKKENVDKE